MNIIKWFEGKKRRVAVISLAIAPMIPEKYGLFFYAAGILFGGADAAKVANESWKNRKSK